MLERDLGLTPDVDISGIAARYHEACIQKHTAHAVNVAEILCSCTAAGITEAFAPNDLVAYGTDTPEGQKIDEIINNEIYIPCTDPAIRQYKYESCMTQKELEGHTKHIEICQCISKSMGIIASSLAPYVIGERAQKYERRYTKDSPDPLAAIMMSKRYSRKDKQINKICVQKYLVW
jgi:hypothetical protein